MVRTGSIKPELSISRILYHCREVALHQCGDLYTVTIDGEPEPYGPYKNPIEAWRQFISTLDSIVCRRIGDMLEQQGCNRYTGELLPDAEQLELK